MRLYDISLYRLPWVWLQVLAAGSLLVSAGCGVPTYDAEPFKVHIVVLIPSSNLDSGISEESLEREVDILNKYFVAESGTPTPRFELNDVVFYEDLKGTSCGDLLTLATATAPYNGTAWETAIDGCMDEKARSPRAINFYIVDSWSEDRGFENANSHGRFNSGRPYVLLDWERLGHNIQSPGEHEMGHAFGLDHVCVEGAKRDSDTNIMASASCGLGSGGLRNIGFNDEQVTIIWQHAEKIRENLEPASNL